MVHCKNWQKNKERKGKDKFGVKETITISIFFLVCPHAMFFHKNEKWWSLPHH